MKVLLSLVLPLAALQGHAQWSLVGDGFLNGQVHDLEYLADSGQLYLGGTVRFIGEPPVQINGIGYYSSGTWHTLNGGVSDTVGALVNPVFAIGLIDEAVFIAGSFHKVDWVPSTSYVAKWHGGAWHSLGLDSSFMEYGPLSRAWRALDGLPNLLGSFDWNLDGVEIKSWAAWDGTQWVPGDPNGLFPFGYSGQINQVVDYNGQRYVGGNFQQWNVPNDLAVLNAGTWEEVGPGIQGDAWVNDLEVFDGKLWVAGEFYSGAGNPATGLMTWDGTQWADPFPQIESIAAGLELLVANDKLYFLGPFTAQGLPGVFRIAEYDGEQLCVIGTNELYQIHSIAASSDTLYAYVFPWGWDHQNVGQWPLDTPADTCYTIVQGMSDTQVSTPRLTLFPNPASEQITLRSAVDLPWNAVVRIVDAAGRLERTIPVQPPGRVVTLPLQGLAPGCYLAVAQSYSLGRTISVPFMKVE